MPDDLATAAVFGDQTQAVAARLHLEAAGIPAFLADEIAAGSIFLWSPAVGGIKLQVPQSRLEEAIRRLDEQIPGHRDEAEDGVAGPDAGEPAAAEPAAAGAEDRTLREQQAELLLRTWMLGLLLLPLLIFQLMQLVWVWTSAERLRPEYRRKARAATVYILASTAVYVVLFWVICGAVPR